MLFTCVAHSANLNVPTITLRSTRSAVLNDGRDFHEIIADVRDSSGSYVSDNTQVTFQSTGGIFSGPPVTSTRAGAARIRLTSLQKGTVTVSAVVQGGGFQQINLAFTDDPVETFQGNLYVDCLSTGSLTYIPGLHIVEATGRLDNELSSGVKLPGASIAFRDIQIFADYIQFDTTSNSVHARGNVRYSRGAKRIECTRLSVSLTGSDSYAIMESEHKLRAVHINNQMVTDIPKGGISPKQFSFEETSEAQQYILARQIRVYPGEKIQFKRPKLYQDGQVIFSVAYYSMNLYSTQIFADQFISVGTQGVGMDLPLFYDLSPASTGILHLRSGERNGRSQFATRPGVSLDMTQGYNSVGGRNRYTGQFDFIGIARQDWGVRWSHSQEFAGNTRGSVFLDVPAHKNLFGSFNLSKQVANFNVGVNASANRSIVGIAQSGTEQDLFLETIPKKLSGTPYSFSVGANITKAHTQTLDFVQNTATQGVQARLYSTPLKLDKKTTLTNYFSMGNMWTNQGRNGAQVMSTLTATRTLSQGASMQLTYDFAHQPLYTLGQGSHKISMNMVMNKGNKFTMFVLGSTLLDAQNTNVVTDFSYSFMPRWKLNLATTLQKFGGASYKDMAFGIARTVFGRDLTFSYSTYNHRFFFDVEASRF